MSDLGVGDAIQKGMAFISSVQLPDGGFDTFSSPDAAPFKPGVTYRTAFAPALILSSLHHVRARDNGVRQKLAAWLAAQKSPSWSFNYWAISAPERTTMPYPDDLDATFCALIALRQQNPALVDEEWLAGAVKLLLATEAKVGGPYRTWLVPKTAPDVWQDIDLAVNSNIACFLSMVSGPLPNLTALMEEAITKGVFRSPYYPNEYPIIYYIARGYTGKNRTDLVRHILERRRGSWWGSPLYSALAVSSLVRLGQRTGHKSTIQKILKLQRPDGSWKAEAFSIDPSIQKKRYYSGSDALTTALVLEALALSGTTKAETATKSQPQADALYKRADASARQEFRRLGPELRAQCLGMLKTIRTKDKNREIVLLPYLFNDSLAAPLPPAQDALLANLGLANLYGWMAYTIYDDFLDDEGDPRLLSAANVALRYSLAHFRQALPKDDFQKLTDQTFDKIDSANAWELAHCRAQVSNKQITIRQFPDFTQTLRLADRSLGHTLTPLGVLAAAGITPDDGRAVLVQHGLRHYLVARQLNDDLHDWEQDLRAGIITYVVAAILKELSVRPGTYSFAKLLPRMQHQFWHHTIINVYKTVAGHTAQARSAAKSSGLLGDTNVITDLADKIDASANKALAEQSTSKKFLAAYSK